MTNGVAAALAAIIALAITGDVMLNEAAGSLFMLHKLFDLIEYLSFWR